MHLHERCIPLRPDQLPALEAYLEQAEEGSWSVHQDVLTGAMQLKGYFEDSVAADQSWHQLQTTLPVLRGMDCSASIIEPQTWQLAYKQYLKPTQLGLLHWVPDWDWSTYTLPASDVAVRLNPGMAFGTGSHETTQLVAQRLVDIKLKYDQRVSSMRVIDVGCGSGILALSAYRLGFGYIAGFDIDPEAIRISQEHVALNAIPLSAVHFYTAGLPDGLKGLQAECVLANIQFDILMPHALSLIEAVAPNGYLILSGLLNHEVDAVLNVYRPLGEARWGGCTVDTRKQGEWSDLMLSQSSNSLPII